ncbi:hypothetical protein [Algoriphagus resistens]|uniref:hypothetical protein n=1 Tax=Algoriphagus resistens TaxID=1750590 RepID=UPI000716ADCB|nr:hypothetical protein [Algoriphagus resistens]
MSEKPETERILCVGANYTKVCPILATHDTFEQAHYHLHQCILNYHNPSQFRFNLNSFIQSLRNITFALQSEKRKIPDFDVWYSKKQEQLKENDLLKKFVEGRNVVVKQGMLESKSKVSSGLFKFRKEKACVIMDIPPFTESKNVLELAKKIWIPGFVAPEHIFIGEEIGIKREWVIESISEKEIISECNSAWIALGNLVGEAHNKICVDFEFSDYCHHKYEEYQIMTETDLDPNLIYKWGWEEKKRKRKK